MKHHQIICVQKICNLQKNLSRSYITPNATKERLMTEYQRAYRYIAGKILDFYLIHTNIVVLKLRTCLHPDNLRYSQD